MPAIDELAQATVAFWEENLLRQAKNRVTAFVVLWRESEAGPTLFLPTESSPLGREAILSRCGIDEDDVHGPPWAAAYIDGFTGEHCAYGIDEALKASALAWSRSNLDNLPSGTYEL